jgi:hypothetical protein
MSWLFSQALVEEYLGVTCSDGEQFAPLSGNPTHLAYLPPDRMTAFSRLSRFGMTFKPLTAGRGEELLTLYLAAFHAKTSAPQERVQESMEPDPGCGVTWRELLARYDLNTSSWRTPQFSLLEDSIEFSETWPRWGLMRDGVSYQRQTLVPPTSETEYGLLPTPLASLGTNGGPNQRDSSGRPGLQMAAMTWPTPISQDAKHSGYAPSGPGKADKLSYAVVRWPTPRAFMHKDSTTDRGKHNLGEVVGGKLNPTWVEWLMGWPLGWTDLKPLETDKFRSWQQQHGVSSSEET